MPKGDRTGPMGRGPRAGRAAGLCTGSETPGYGSSKSGRGSGMGSGNRLGGGGQRRRNRFYSTNQLGRVQSREGAVRSRRSNSEVEKQELMHQAEAFRSQLEVIQKRLSDLESRNVPE